jgi:hypothetical protein
MSHVKHEKSASTHNEKLGPRPPMLLSYTDEAGVKHAHVLKLDEREAVNLMIRTARWASWNGVELTIKPIQ